MSESTITAEGGTIRLVTAPDGSISASSADFAVAVVQQVEGGATAPTEYASVAALIAASEGSLAPGYYEVVCEWITYWDGAVFCPPPPSGGGIVTDDGTLVYQDLASDPAVVTFIAPQPVFPGIRDYAGLIPDADLSTATTLLARDKRGLLHGFDRKKGQFGYFEDLRILGDCVIRSMMRMLSAVPSNISILDFGAGGAGEANNRVYNANLLSAGPSFESQSGSAVSSVAYWRLPGRMLGGAEWLVEWRRESDVLTAFINGLQLRRVYDTSNVTVGAGGAVTFATPTGGTSGTFCTDDFAADVNVDAYYGSIENALTGPSPAAYAVGKREWTAAELDWLTPTDYAAVGAAPNVVLCLQPTVNGLEDTSGTIDYATDWTVEDGTSSLAIANAYYTDGDQGTSTAWRAVYKADLDNLTDLSIRMRWMFTSASTNQAGAKVDTTSPGNHSWFFAVYSGSSYVRFFHRHGGTSRVVDFGIDPMAAQEVREWHVKRTHNGATSTIECWERKYPSDTWTKLTVSSVAGSGSSGTGTEVGTVVSANPGGGATSRVYHHYDPDPMIQLVVFDEAIDP